MKKFNIEYDLSFNNIVDRLEIEQALKESKDVCFTLYNTIDNLTIVRDSENTYKLIHEYGSKERIINSSISEEIIADIFIDCVLSMYRDSELSNGYIEIK